MNNTPDTENELTPSEILAEEFSSIAEQLSSLGTPDELVGSLWDLVGEASSWHDTSERWRVLAQSAIIDLLEVTQYAKNLEERLEAFEGGPSAMMRVVDAAQEERNAAEANLEQALLRIAHLETQIGGAA